MYIPCVGDTNWLTSEEMRLWRSFLAASLAVVQNIEADLKEDSGIPLDDYEVLVHLSESEQHRLRMSDLSACLNSSRSRLTQRIDRMVKRGLVAREQCPDDRRSTFAVITTLGLETIAKAAPDHLVSVRRHLVDHVSSEDVPSAADLFELLAAKANDGYG